MAYTLAQFITQATGGGAVQVVAVTPNSDVELEIGGKTITLSERHATKVVDGNKSIAPITNTETDLRVLDLGTLFTANEVLASESLKKAISDEVVEVDAGTVALSRTAVV